MPVPRRRRHSRSARAGQGSEDEGRLPPGQGLVLAAEGNRSSFSVQGWTVDKRNRGRTGRGKIEMND